MIYCRAKENGWIMFKYPKLPDGFERKVFIGKIWGEGWRILWLFSDRLAVSNRVVFQKCCAQPEVTILHLGGGLSSYKIDQRYCYIYSWRRSQDPASRVLFFPWLILLYFCIPSVPWFVIGGVQLLTCVPLFATLWTAHQASLSFTISWSSLKLMSIELVMPSNYLILCHPLLLLPSVFPSKEPESALWKSGKVKEAEWSSFPTNQKRGSGGQKGICAQEGLTGVLFSFINIQKNTLKKDLIAFSLKL